MGWIDPCVEVSTGSTEKKTNAFGGGGCCIRVGQVLKILGPEVMGDKKVERGFIGADRAG